MTWRTVALKDIGRIAGGGTPSTSDPDNFGDAHPWITPKDMSRQRARFMSAGERGISERGLANSAARIIPAGSVLISSRAPIGLTSIAAVPVTTNQGCRSFIPGDEADSLFMYYLLGAMTDEFERRANGSTFKEISGTSLGSIEVQLPPLAEQRGIAATLGALDDRIDSNQRAIATVLSLAHALYEEALGAGSRQEAVGDVADFHNRRRVPLSRQEREARAGDIPYYGATGVFGYVDDFLFDEILVLVGEDGSVVRDDGGPVLQYIWGKAWINNHAHPLTGRGISAEVLYLALDRSDIRPLVTGAVQPKVSMGNLKTLLLELPTTATQSRLEGQLSSLFALWRGRADENRRLDQMRRALIPELLSGRIRVKEAVGGLQGVA